MSYVEIGVGVERHWKSAVFTYSSDIDLSPNDLVTVPFGAKKKIGIVLQNTSRPNFPVKQVYEKLPAALSLEALKFMEWFQKFYALSYGELYAQFIPGYLTNSKKVLSDAPMVNRKDISMSKAQQVAVAKIKSTDKPTILQGITGAGKTRLYISLISETLSAGKNALLLYPEISLTNQLVTEIEQYAVVYTFHSQLTTRQRSDLWLAVAQSQKPVIIAGPRSALFLPHKNLGLIIVDEAHESSYKQDSDIRYNGLFVAGGLAKSHGAKLVLGSATPPISESELLIKSGGSLVELHEKAITSDYSHAAHVINMNSKELFKKHPLISDKLLSAIAAAIDENKQVLLFLNRRGTAKLLLCEVCDWQFECANCELPMTYHHDLHKMLCHTCGSREAAPSSCPECGKDTSMKSFGSKALVEEVQRLFPDAKIARFDSDTDKKDSFNARYEEVHSGKIDILIGTQQIAKGVDLPKLKVVGVLQADLSLHFPDYSSGERTFQLISQVLGRVGRGHGESEVYVQTYQPNSPLMQLAVSENWSAFRQMELAERKKHNFPPFVFTAKLIFRDKAFDKAISRAQKVRKSIEKSFDLVSVDGPLPSFYGKKGGFYYIQLHLRSNSRSDILRVCQTLPPSVIKDLDPTTLL